MRGLAVDLTPLRASRDYRYLWFGELVSHTGRHITVVALPFQVFELTGSPLLVGMIGLVQVVPLVAFSLAAGVVADRMDRRRLLALSQAGLAVSSGLLAALTIGSRPPLWALYAVAALIGALSGLESPTRTAVVPRLVGDELIPSAVALEQTLFQLSDIVGPAVGGLIIATLGLSSAYVVDALTFVVALLAVLAIRPLPPDPQEQGTKRLAAFTEGFRYLKGRPVLQSTFSVDLIAMVFGMPRALFPQIADQAFRGPEEGGLAFAVLFAAIPAGAVVGGVFSGWVSGVSRQGVAVVVAILVWGLAMTGFGVATALADSWPRAMLVAAVLMLVIGGAADMASAAFRMSMLQSAADDAVRGRLQGIFLVVVVGGPRIADVAHGASAALVGTAAAAAGGGVLVVVGTVVAAIAVPSFVRYRVTRA
jgi:MFS family permease